jgi:hypothetical protein
MRKLIVLTTIALGLLLVAPAASALASAHTFYVHPSHGDDTANIQAAFNAAVKAGPGSTVQLSGGHFYTNTASPWGMPSAPASSWRIVGNDVSGVTPTGDQYGVSTAQIWLGTDADHCLIVGGKAQTRVLDQGTSDILINVTRVPLPATALASPAGQAKRMLMKGIS